MLHLPGHLCLQLQPPLLRTHSSSLRRFRDLRRARPRPSPPPLMPLTRIGWSHGDYPSRRFSLGHHLLHRFPAEIFTSGKRQHYPMPTEQRIMIIGIVIPHNRTPPIIGQRDYDMSKKGWIVILGLKTQDDVPRASGHYLSVFLTGSSVLLSWAPREASLKCLVA